MTVTPSSSERAAGDRVDHPLAGRMATRRTANGRDFCPIEGALERVGTRSAMILLREVFYGGRRFDDLARSTGLSDAVAAKRLKQLVQDGLLAQQPYREPGARTRYEYVLTEKGRDFFPVVVAMFALIVLRGFWHAYKVEDPFCRFATAVRPGGSASTGRSGSTSRAPADSSTPSGSGSPGY